MSNEIDYKKIDIEASGMLGDINDKGEYVIADKIKNELNKAIKIITEYSMDNCKAEATVDAYSFNFEILFEQGMNNKKRATMFLVEKSKQGYLGQVKTQINQQIFDDDGSFLYELKKAFNLILKDESEGKDIKNLFLYEILNKKKAGLTHYKDIMGLTRDLDMEYVLKLLALLSKDKKVGKEIIFDFKNQFKLLHLSRADAKYGREARLLLDKLINARLAELDTDISKSIDKTRSEYFKDYSATKVVKPNSTSSKKKKDEKKKEDDDDKKKASAKAKSGGGTNFNPSKLDDFALFIPISKVKTEKDNRDKGGKRPTNQKPTIKNPNNQNSGEKENNPSKPTINLTKEINQMSVSLDSYKRELSQQESLENASYASKSTEILKQIDIIKDNEKDEFSL